MGVFFIYILKSSVCLVLFYLFFRLLLSKETFHRFNRVALLGVLFFSLLIPCIEVTTRHQVEVQQAMLTIEQMLMMAELEVAPVEAGTVQETTAISWIQIVLLLYLAGILFLACRNIYSLICLLRLISSGKHEKLEKGITLVVHNQEIAPFSWMKYIVISQKDQEENGREILIHEIAHIHHRHSIDLLVADICIFFQWFNPGAWLLKQELQNIHEYEADETVINEGVNAKEYQLLLIKKAVGTRLYSMANSFNHSKLKKRITMMLKEKSSPWARMKYLYVLPLAAIAVTAFARPEISKQVEEISAVKVNDLTAIVETKVAESMGNVLEARAVKAMPQDTTKAVKAATGATDPVEGTVFEVVENMPEYPGGVAALMQYFRENLRYPASAHKAGIQGRVTIEFIIDKDGSIKAPKVVHSVDKDLDAESIRLIKSLPNWKPGMQKGQPVAVRYTVPIMFRLNEDDGSLIRVSSREEPLYIINGKETDAEIMRALDPQNIESIDVLKDENAIKRFGEKGKNGVILITLKKGSSSAITVTGVKTTVKSTTDIPGVGGVYMSNKKVDMKDVNLYIDGELVKMEGKQIEDFVPADQIESVSVNKSDDGKGGDIYIVTKKNAKNQEKTTSQGNMKVMGAVKDEKGEPIIAASVLIEGTTTGTISDNNGNFVLSVPNKNAVLLVSYINMKTAKVKVSSKMTVVLKEE